MTLIIMKVLIVTVFGMILSIPFFSEAGGGDFDLEQIKTVHGRIYREIHILGADAHGLSFRHRDGVAKLGFASLAENLRMLYEVVEEVGIDEAAVEEVTSGKEHDGQQEGSGWAERGSYSAVPLVLTVHNRVTFPSPALWLGGGYSGGARTGWPTHWHRYRPVHELINPYFRELTVRDFLYTSGLVPMPPGIAACRIP